MFAERKQPSQINPLSKISPSSGRCSTVHKVVKVSIPHAGFGPERLLSSVCVEIAGFLQSASILQCLVSVTSGDDQP
jgi:hypothetical protein